MSLSDLIRQIVKQVLGDDPYRTIWECRVVRQNADGSLDVVPENEKMTAEGLRGIKVRYGVAGFTNSEIPAGAQVALAFLDGDSSKPYLLSFLGVDADVAFQKGSKAVSRVGDTVDLGVWSYTSTSGDVLQVTPPGAPAPIVISPVGVPLTATISSGNERLKA